LLPDVLTLDSLVIRSARKPDAGWEKVIREIAVRLDEALADNEWGTA
jgi:hypothetical protein